MRQKHLPEKDTPVGNSRFGRSHHENSTPRLELINLEKVWLLLCIYLKQKEYCFRYKPCFTAKTRYSCGEFQAPHFSQTNPWKITSPSSTKTSTSFSAEQLSQ